MSTIKLLGICLAALVFSPVSPIYAQEPFKYEKDIAALVKPYVDHDKLMGCSIGGIVDGKPWFGNFGQLSESNTELPNKDTVYEIGSASKVFTSLLLADSIESGELKLDSLVGDMVPELKETKFGQSVTLKHLSTHRSRLPASPADFVSKNADDPYSELSRADVIAYIKSNNMRGGLGRRYEYSNMAVGMLGDILATQSDSSYEDALKKRVLQPLKMNDTSIKLSADQESRFASPHNSALLPDHPWTFDLMNGAGGIRSTTSDMVTFIEANLKPNGDAIGKAIELAWTEQMPASTGSPAMGLGWHIHADGSTRWHNGQTGGFHSMLMINRKLNVGIVLLCNTASMEFDELGVSILQTVVGQNPKPRTFAEVFDVDERTAKRLAGMYELAPGVKFEVVIKNKKMVAKLTGQTFLELEPESDTVWNYKAVKAQLHFDLPDKGPATKVTLHQNGGEQTADRIDD